MDDSFIRSSLTTQLTSDQFPVGFIAQFVEHCSAIARSWVRAPVKPGTISQAFVTSVACAAYNCDDRNLS